MNVLSIFNILEYMMHDKSVKEIAKKLRCDGETYVRIGEILGISKHAARGIIVNKKKPHICKRGPHFKLQKKDMLSIKRQVSLLTENGEKVTSPKIIKNCDLKVSKFTVQRFLRTKDYLYKKARMEINLSKRHKTERIRIISDWISKNQEWEKVIFSDEKRFSMDGPDNWNSYVKRNSKLVREKRQCKGGGINIWMMVLPNGLLAHRVIEGNFCSNKYNEMLKDMIVPILKLNFGEDFFFQQDNSSIHRAKNIKKFFQDSSIKLIEWPAKSPDLNIVEDLWKAISDKVYDGPSFHKKEFLLLAINQAISEINAKRRDIIHNLYSGFRHRLTKVLISKGNLCNK